MRLLVTGASGQLGRDVVRAAAERGHHVAGLDHAHLDIADPSAMDRVLSAERPDAIVNCAAYTDVDGAQADPETAMAINGRAPGHLATSATRSGARLVHVSSDYVFDGRRRTPYVESDEPNPLSVYGASKLAGEQAVAGAGPGHVVVRSAWLFGVGGQNFPQTMLRLAGERDGVGVVTDQVGCPTWTGHLAPALVALAEGTTSGVHHVAAAGQCSWHDFAVEIFRLAGANCAVAERTTTDLGRPAPRPAYSALATERSDTPVLPPWTEGLRAFLEERARAGAGLPA